MSVPDHLRRYPTAAAIDALAARFGLRNRPDMQDWEWEVADPTRVDEFVAAYENGELTDEERFTLMEIIIQSFEDLGPQPELDPRWQRVLDILDRNIDLHACSVWYWSALDTEIVDEQWRVTPSIRRIRARHLARLEKPQA